MGESERERESNARGSRCPDGDAAAASTGGCELDESAGCGLIPHYKLQLIVDIPRNSFV